MRFRHRIISAIFSREISGAFSTPAGYVFISLFVFLSALAAFWQERFFIANLANLDQLNRYFPYLLVFFLPAIGMTLWAEERKQGTEELLLTLPASYLEIVLGKYFAAVAIYTVALLFSLSHVAVLLWLGSPDPGLTITTYFGYWLVGSTLLALVMLASLLTDNLTVAFIVGALFCAVPVFIDRASAISTFNFARTLESLSVVEQFRDLAGGVVTLSAVTYFCGLAVAGIYLNVVLLGRKHWATGPRAPRMALHVALRGVALAAIAGSLTMLASQVRFRFDATSEQIHSLAPETKKLLAGISKDQPVFITAYISPEVPRSYVDGRNNLLNMLREFDAAAPDSVRLRIVETLKYSPQAREALERYNIRPSRIPAAEESAGSLNEIFLGVAFTCGGEEFVIPFFDRGLPAEYELMRSVRVVSGAKRKKVGVLDTAAGLFGGFNFQARSQTAEWPIVAELRKQYEVVRVSPDADYPAGLDAMLVTLPGSMNAEQLSRLTGHAKSGNPLLVLLDPLPAFSPQLPQEGNLRSLLELLGVTWQPANLAWDNYNPHTQLKSLPKEFLFIKQGFNPKDAVTNGLQEVVMLYAGTIGSRSDARTTFTSLMETSRDSGTLRADQAGGGQQPDHKSGGTALTVAARVKGSANAIIVGDADLIGEQFFELRRRGIEGLNFDNVTFTLNAVDDLAGDPSFISLRKRRPKYRTLEAVEKRTREYENQRQNESAQAEELAGQRLKEAQARLDRQVAEVEARRDMDDETRQIMIGQLQQVESRRLTVTRSTIEDEKQRQIETSRSEMENAIRGIENTIKLLAVALPPIPAILLFFFVSVRRLARERIGVSADRLIGEEPKQ